MIDSDAIEQSQFLKSDALGRTRTTRQQREAILDQFEAGGLSGPEFARVHGINYQTFATWRQRRKRERCESPLPTQKEATVSPAPSFTLVEAEVESSKVTLARSDETLVIECGEDLRLSLTSSKQADLAVAFLRRWNSKLSGC